MGVIKKLVGWFVLLAFGVTGMIFAIIVVAFSQDALVRDYTSNVPKQVVRDLPPLADQALRVISKSPDMAKDPEAQKWLVALEQAPMKLSEVFEKSGLKTWFERELVVALSQLGETTRGTTTAKPIQLRLGPYYAALTGPVMQEYVKGVVAKLPPCKIDQQARWAAALTKPSSEIAYPACSPSEDVLRLGWAQWRAEITKKPQEHTFLTQRQSQEMTASLVMARMFSWLAFLFPLGLLCLGAIIVTSTGTRGFLMSMGFTIALSGAIVWSASFGTKESLTQIAASGIDLTRITSGLPFVSDRASQKLAEMGLPFLKMLIDPMLRSFSSVSSWVVGAGMGMFLVSFLIAARRKQEDPPQVLQVVRVRR